jgi:hypothetical protein
MNRWIAVPLAVLTLWPGTARAQEQASPTWWAVFTEWVAPDNVMAFEEASAEMHEAIVANAPEGMAYYTLSGPETGYMYAIPMESMTDFMTLNEQWMGMVEKVGWDKWDEMSAKADPLVEKRAMNFFVEMPDGSYHPDGFEEAMADRPARHFDYLYPKPGMEAEFNDVMKEWVALYEKNGLDAGWTAYQAVSGEDLPLVVLITPATSAGAYYMMSEDADERLGQEGQELMMKSLGLMRDFEHSDAEFRPELSVLPPDTM